MLFLSPAKRGYHLSIKLGEVRSRAPLNVSSAKRWTLIQRAIPAKRGRSMLGRPIL
jgi:hypothetical protein